MSLTHPLRFFSSFAACSHSLSICFQPCENWSFSQPCWWRRNYSGAQSLVAQEIVETRSKYFTTSFTGRPLAQKRLTPPKRQYLPIDMALFSRMPELSGLRVPNLYTRWMGKVLFFWHVIDKVSGTRWTEYRVGPRSGPGVTAVIKIYAFPPNRNLVLQVIYVIKSTILTGLSPPMHV